MKVYVEKTGKTVKYNRSFKSAILLLKELKINPDAVIVVKNNEVILNEEPVEKDDEIKLFSVVSGG